MTVDLLAGIPVREPTFRDPGGNDTGFGGAQPDRDGRKPPARRW
jgi:hypothetical protein